MNLPSEKNLSQAYSLMESGKLNDARIFLYDALEDDLENKELHFAYWCCNFWGADIEAAAPLYAEERGERIFERWIDFCETLARSSKENGEKQGLEKLRPESNPRALYATKIGVFTVAMQAYKQVEVSAGDDATTVSMKADIMRRLGICSKEIGNYDEALSYFKEANKLSPFSAAIFAEMADCFALSGLERNAKLYFREAFFLDAQKIELAFLDSALIKSVEKVVNEKGYTKSALLEWIPIYGELMHVFNIKRELKPQEVNKLIQEVYALENEVRDPSNSQKILVPKLINMYFRLIDHYEHSADASAAQKSSEYQLQIRALDEEIYRLYTAQRAK